jgi:hypothetical protein
VVEQARLTSKLGNPDSERTITVTGTGSLSSREETILIHGAIGTTGFLLTIFPGVLVVRYVNAEVTSSQP